MNYIPEVAKMLGVEIGEEFKIESCSDKKKYSDNAIFKFDELYLKYKPHDEWILATCAQSDLLNGKLKLIKIPKPILDQKEEEYLSYVIKPFKKDVISITKYRCTDSLEEYIYIKTRNAFTCLPYFKEGVMYKGMKANRKYTLEELGL